MNAYIGATKEGLKLVWTGLALSVIAFIVGLFNFSSLANQILFEGFNLSQLTAVLLAIGLVMISGSIGVLFGEFKTKAKKNIHLRNAKPLDSQRLIFKEG